MSVVDYDIMTAGYADKNIELWKKYRLIAYEVFNSYVDRKKYPNLPRSPEGYMPLTTNEAGPKLTKRQQQRENEKLQAKIRQVEESLNTLPNV